MVTSFKRSRAGAATLSASNPEGGHCQAMPLPETPLHSQASLGQSLVGSLLLVCCTHNPCPCGSPLLTRTSTGDTQTQFCLSVCGVSGSSCMQGLFGPSECLWPIWGLILNSISPLLTSCWGFSFPLDVGHLFFGRIQQSPVDGCSAASCNFGVLAGEDEFMSFYSAILIPL